MRTEFDYSKLCGRIVERFGTRKAFAKALKINENTLSKKLNNNRGISGDDIYKWCGKELLDIKPEEVSAYFFEIKVQDVEQEGRE